MIDFKHITKKYGDKYALNDLSFSIDEGQIVGLIGPNGAGKSTTMNIITGFIEQTSGDVIVNGYDTLRHPKKAKQSIGYMAENVPVYMDMTVFEFVKFMAELHGVKRSQSEEKAYIALEKTRAVEVINKLCRNISRGYRQRVSLAAAIASEPEILILDEPTVGLDPKQIIEIRKLIKEIGKKSTVIISSHILSEISQICDKVIVINDGKLVTIDSPENIENYENNQNIIVSVEDEKNILEKHLDTLKYIKSYEILSSNDETKVKKVLIKPKDEQNVKNKLLKDLAIDDLSIIEFTKQKATLEEAFINLTKTNKGEKKNVGVN